MTETERIKGSMDVNRSKRNVKPRVFDPAISKFFIQLPSKLQSGLQVSPI